MSKFTLMLRTSGNPFASLSPAEIQAIVGRYAEWAGGLQAAGKLAGSHKLRDGEGRVMRRGGGSVTVTDGPFTEAKEVIGGLFIIEAASYDDAVRVAGDCPHLDFGSVEVREVEVMRGS